MNKQALAVHSLDATEGYLLGNSFDNDNNDSTHMNITSYRISKTILYVMKSGCGTISRSEI